MPGVLNMRPILVDCDGVISDMTRSVLALAHERSIALDKGPDDITNWEYTISLAWSGADEAITRAVREREFVYRMHPYPGAFMALRRLEQAFGADNVLVCTSPWNAEWASQRYAWLQDFAGVSKKRVVMCTRKELVSGFLIDDHAKNLAGRPFHDAWLVARPHNVGAPFTRGTLEQAVDLLVQDPPAYPDSIVFPGAAPGGWR
jgi:5'(3')-deoxyribonucleotidase